MRNKRVAKRMMTVKKRENGSMENAMVEKWNNRETEKREEYIKCANMKI